MSTLIRIFLLLPVWAAALWGCLQLHTLNTNLGHSICGAWGCGPPTEALIGFHAFWCVLLFPIVFAVAAYLNSDSARKVGWALLLVGAITCLAVAGFDTFRYWQDTESTSYLGQRFLFAIVTKVDVPMLQVVTAGIFTLIGNGFLRRSKGPEAFSLPETASEAKPLPSNG